MINKLIEKQLEKLEIAKLGPYDPIKKVFIIPKHIVLELEVNNYYILKLKDHIINPPQNSTLVTNWNNNTHPVYPYVRACVTRKMGDMVKLETCSYDVVNNQDLSDIWIGWIKKDDAEIIAKL